MTSRQETGRLETYDFVAADHSVGEGVVIMKTLSGGFDIFGLTISEPEPCCPSNHRFTRGSLCDWR